MKEGFLSKKITRLRNKLTLGVGLSTLGPLVNPFCMAHPLNDDFFPPLRECSMKSSRTLNSLSANEEDPEVDWIFDSISLRCRRSLRLSCIFS